MANDVVVKQIVVLFTILLSYRRISKSHMLLQQFKRNAVPISRLWACESISIFAGRLESMRRSSFVLMQVIKDLNYKVSLTHTRTHAL